MTGPRYTVSIPMRDAVGEGKMRTPLISTTICVAVGLALAWIPRVDYARAQEPTPTPSLSFDDSASPPSGTSIVPPVPFSYSLTISNVGETLADSLVIQFDTIDVTGLFSSTQGACTWTLDPDYHGHGTAECDLGALSPAANAAITLDGETFWNFYSHDYAGAWIAVNGTPISRGFTYPFATPNPTATPTPSNPVGGVAELPPMEGSSEGNALPTIVAGAGVGLLGVAAVWLARRRRSMHR